MTACGGCDSSCVAGHQSCVVRHRNQNRRVLRESSREQACHESRAAWITGHAGDMKLRESSSFFRQLIKRGCLRIRMPVATEIAVTKIIGEHENDVRRPLSGCWQGKPAKREAHEKKEAKGMTMSGHFGFLLKGVWWFSVFRPFPGSGRGHESPRTGLVHHSGIASERRDS